jgi:hypothetical protein
MNDAMSSIGPELERSRRSDVYGVWIRRAGLAVLGVVVVVAALNIVGQRATTAAISSPSATMNVHAPTRVRAGLLFQVRISVTARVALPDAAIVLSSGFIDGLTLNTSEPGAASETSGRGGSVVLHIGGLQAGQSYVEYLDYQVNPTSFSSRSQTVTLTSNTHAILSIHRTFAIVP